MVYVCQIGDGPDLRLFPDLRPIGKDDHTDFITLKVRIPATRRIPKLCFVETTKFARANFSNEGGHVGEFEVAVEHPEKFIRETTKTKVCAFIFISAREVEPVPHDRGLRGLGPALKYIRSRRQEILAELRQAFGLAELLF